MSVLDRGRYKYYSSLHSSSESNHKKVWKVGKITSPIDKKYKTLRKKLQKRKRRKVLKKIKNKESQIIRNLNHTISKKIAKEAEQNHSGIVPEELQEIRRRAKTSKKLRVALNC